MSAILENCLFKKDPVRFEKLREEVKQFNALCNGHNVIQDDIFNVIQNYARKKGYTLQLIRYPIKDDDFCACTFIRKGTLFVFVNSALALSKQIFAAAHELYHLKEYVDDKNPEYSGKGSILDSVSMDEKSALKEDMEANAFAGLLLAPKEFLFEQIDIYGINTANIQMRDVITLMDIFAIPYKAVVLRLFEDDFISENGAVQLFQISESEINRMIQITGKAKRWQEMTGVIELGSLREKLTTADDKGFGYEERTDDDMSFLRAAGLLPSEWGSYGK